MLFRSHCGVPAHQALASSQPAAADDAEELAAVGAPVEAVGEELTGSEAEGESVGDGAPEATAAPDED